MDNIPNAYEVDEIPEDLLRSAREFLMHSSFYDILREECGSEGLPGALSIFGVDVVCDDSIMPGWVLATGSAGERLFVMELNRDVRADYNG